MKHPIIAAALFGIVCALAACAGQPPPPPPPAMAETIPNPPVTITPLIWQPGYWDWTGSSYAWQPGRYVPSAGHSNMWMPGWWAQTTNGGYAWQPAHWQ